MVFRWSTMLKRYNTESFQWIRREIKIGSEFTYRSAFGWYLSLPFADLFGFNTSQLARECSLSNYTLWKAEIKQLGINETSLRYIIRLHWSEGSSSEGFGCVSFQRSNLQVSGEEILPKRPAGASLSFRSYERILKLPEAKRGALGAIQFFCCDPQQLCPRATLGITSPLLPLLLPVIPLLLDIRDLLIWIHYDEAFHF